MMKNKKHSGSALIIAAFTVAILATLVAGILAITADQSQILANQTGAQEAFEIAEAGINDAIAAIRLDRLWQVGFIEKPFAGGSYTLEIDNSDMSVAVMNCIAKSRTGYTAKITARMTIGSQPPYLVRIDQMKVN